MRPEESSQGGAQKLAARRPEMNLENSPKYHSIADGMLENAVQRVIGLTRVLTEALEANIKQAIEPKTRVMTFMVKYAVTIINRVSVGQDRKTPVEQRKRTRSW